MPKKKTNDEFVKELAEKNPTIIPMSEYISGHTKIQCKCVVCGHIWSVMPYSILQGIGCPECGIQKNKQSRTKSNDIFLKELNAVNPDVNVLEQYVNDSTKIKCECKKCNYIWEARPNTLLRGFGCPQCAGVARKSNETFCNEMESINPNIIIHGEYVSLRERILCECKKCGYKWKPYPKTLLNGEGCPQCGGRVPIKGVNDFATLHSNLLEEWNYELNNIAPESIREGSSRRVGWICSKCGYHWYATVYDRSIGSGCPRCSGNLRKTNEDYVSELKEINPNIIATTSYTNSQTNVTFKCLKCGNEWTTKPYHILNGHGCPKCGYEKVKEKTTFSKADVVKRIAEINPDVKLIGEYKNTNTKVECLCNICNSKWFVTPSNLLGGHGCPSCVKTSTSFMEQFIYRALSIALPGYQVLSRDKEAIGRELDIYIPDMNFAIEPGSDHWHKYNHESDKLKQKLCNEKGIRLITIYDAVKEPSIFENKDIWTYKIDLAAERNLKTLKSVVYRLLTELSVDYIFNEDDWKNIRLFAYENSRKKQKNQN